MDFRFFEGLSKVEALEFLEQYRQIESSAWTLLIEDARRNEVDANFSTASIAAVFSWLLRSARATEIAPGADVPLWIRESKNLGPLVDLDERSRVLAIRASFYLGESFVREHSKLRWTIGSPDRAEQQMPVISGFNSRLELAPILVTENLFLDHFASSKSSRASIEGAVRYWLNRVPGRKGTAD